MNFISNSGNNIILKHVLDNTCIQKKSAILRSMMKKWDIPKHQVHRGVVVDCIYNNVKGKGPDMES